MGEKGQLLQPLRTPLSLSPRTCYWLTWVQPVSDSSGVHPLAALDHGPPIMKCSAQFQGASWLFQGTDSSPGKALRYPWKTDTHKESKPQEPGGLVIAQIHWSVSQKSQHLYRYVIQSEKIGRKLPEGDPILVSAFKQNASSVQFWSWSLDGVYL